MTTTTKDPLPRSKQQTGLAAWNRNVEARLEDLRKLPQCREDAMDARRRRESLRRTQETVDELLAQRSQRTPGPTAVVVHRSRWVQEKLTALLAAAGVTVVGSADDGAQGLAHAVVRQPDLLVIEDHLAWTTSVELVRSARLFAPHSHLVVQADDVDLGNECVEAGAEAVFSRQVSLAELCERSVQLLDAA